MPMDKMFGTFRDKLKVKGTTYNGGSEEKVDEKSVRLHDTKANFSKTLPEVGFVIYMGLNMLLWGILYCAFKQIPLLDGGTKRIDCPTTMALLISVGPIAIAQAMTMLTEASRRPRPVLYPFHKDKVIHTMFHLSVSILFVVPVFLLVHTMLSSPGEAFFRLFSSCIVLAGAFNMAKSSYIPSAHRFMYAHIRDIYICNILQLFNKKMLFLKT